MGFFCDCGAKGEGFCKALSRQLDIYKKVNGEIIKVIATDTSASVRAKACLSLDGIGIKDEATVHALFHALSHDKEKEVVSASSETLVSFGKVDKIVTEVLLRVLKTTKKRWVTLETQVDQFF